MGTNYYLTSHRNVEAKAELQDLKRTLHAVLQASKLPLYAGDVGDLSTKIDDLSLEGDSIHIGKFSCGWKFCFQGKNFRGLTDFIMKFDPASYSIQDEYGRLISQADFVQLVEGSKPGKREEDFINAEGYRITTYDFT
jgi:hypothetical protein